MKFFAKLILILIIVPISLIVLVSLTIRLQLLDPNFWKSDFKNNNIYVSLSNDLKVYAEDQNIKGGGKTSDLKVVTNIITPTIVEDFTTHNLDNSLGFINGTKKELLVYIPISKIPKELAPKSVGLNTEEIPLTALMTKFNIDASTIPVSQIAYFGQSINYLLIISIIILLFCLLCLFLLIEKGDKLIAIGLPLILSGFVVLSFSRVFVSIQITNKILYDFLPSILLQISKVWSLVGILLLITGVVLLFIRKRTHDSR